MISYRTKGIILKKRDLKGADRFLTVYTDRFGKIQTLAKGAKRTTAKLAGHLEDFTLTDLVFIKGKNFNTITSSISLNRFSYLRNNLERIACAYYIAELIDKLISEVQTDERIFKLILKLFDKLNHPKGKLNLIIRYFELNLADLLGYRPEFERCLNCKTVIKPNKNYFSSKLGGLLCQNCKSQDLKAFEIKPDTIKILRILSEKDIDFIERLVTNSKIDGEVERVTSNFLEFILDEPIRLDSFLENLGCKIKNYRFQ